MEVLPQPAEQGDGTDHSDQAQEKFGKFFMQSLVQFPVSFVLSLAGHCFQHFVGFTMMERWR
jgi:hypothetical protein